MAKQKTPEPILPRLMTVKDAAAYLSCSLWAVRQLIWNNEVPSLRIGNRDLFDKHDIDAFIEKRKARA